MPEQEENIYEQLTREAQNKKEEEEKESRKEEKQNRTIGFVGALGDAARSISNLYFTTQYAPNAFTSSEVGEKMQQRADKLKEQRKAAGKAWDNYILNLRTGDFNYKEKKAAEKKADGRYEEAQELARRERERADNDRLLASYDSIWSGQAYNWTDNEVDNKITELEESITNDSSIPNNLKDEAKIRMRAQVAATRKKKAEEKDRQAANLSVAYARRSTTSARGNSNGAKRAWTLYIDGRPIQVTWNAAQDVDNNMQQVYVLLPEHYRVKDKQTPTMSEMAGAIVGYLNDTNGDIKIKKDIRRRIMDIAGDNKRINYNDF